MNVIRQKRKPEVKMARAAGGFVARNSSQDPRQRGADMFDLNRKNMHDSWELYRRIGGFLPLWKLGWDDFMLCGQRFECRKGVHTLCAYIGRGDTLSISIPSKCISCDSHLDLAKKDLLAIARLA